MPAQAAKKMLLLMSNLEAPSAMLKRWAEQGNTKQEGSCGIPA